MCRSRGKSFEVQSTAFSDSPGVRCTHAGAQVDPTLTRADRLVGQVLGEVGALPDVFTELEINFFLLRRLLGVRTMVRPCSFLGGAWLS